MWWWANANSVLASSAMLFAPCHSCSEGTCYSKAIARTDLTLPRPFPAPVTTATLPSNRSVMIGVCGGERKPVRFVGNNLCRAFQTSPESEGGGNFRINK